MRFTLDLPTSDQAMVYGHDPVLGWYASLVDACGREELVYNALEYEYDHTRPLRGLLAWMSEVTELFDLEDLEEALERLIHELPEELPDHLRVVAEILENLRAAAEFE